MKPGWRTALGVVLTLCEWSRQGEVDQLAIASPTVRQARQQWRQELGRSRATDGQRRGAFDAGLVRSERPEQSLGRLARYAPAREERREDVILPISQLFHDDDGPHIVYVAPNARTHYEQQLRETGPIGPGALSPQVKRIPTPAEESAALSANTPARGQELRDVLNSSLATMRSLETRNSGPQPTATELVPIQELLYRGQRAIERAAEIRRALKKSGTPPTRALVDELVDLVELASAE